MSDIVLVRALEVLPGNKIQVPDVQATSAFSSPTLEYELRKLGLDKFILVDLNTALAAIPGSSVYLMPNLGSPVAKYFVLPPFDPDSCQCPQETDWYSILKRLVDRPVDVEDKFHYCDVLSKSQCPSPEFTDYGGGGPRSHGPKAGGGEVRGGVPVDPYVKEGTNIPLEFYTP